MQVLAAAPGRRRRRPRPANPAAEPPELPLTRVTVVGAGGFEDEEDAERWLAAVSGDEARTAQELAVAAQIVNEALHALRAASGDPYVPDVSPARALAARIGYGDGQQVADGSFREARDLPLRGDRRRRREDLRPQERIAAVIGAREQVDACEELLLRARVDLDAGRLREAALQLRVGLEALLVELQGALADPEHDADMEALAERRRQAGDAANAALRGEPSDGDAANVRELLELSERVLRRRRLLRG